MKLSKRERNFLKTPVSFGWNLYEQVSGAFCWDDDPTLTYKIGVTFHRCLDNGLIEELPSGNGLKRYRATALALRFKCPVSLCRRGNEVIIDEEDGLADMTGNKCSVCEGTGLVSEVKM